MGAFFHRNTKGENVFSNYSKKTHWSQSIQFIVIYHTLSFPFSENWSEECFLPICSICILLVQCVFLFKQFTGYFVWTTSFSKQLLLFWQGWLWVLMLFTHLAVNSVFRSHLQSQLTKCLAFNRFLKTGAAMWRDCLLLFWASGKKGENLFREPHTEWFSSRCAEAGLGKNAN